MRKALTFALALPLAGCLAGKLRGPVEDHYVQTRVISDTCAAGGYAVNCPADLLEDLEAMKAQACALDAITRGEQPECEAPK